MLQWDPLTFRISPGAESTCFEATFKGESTVDAGGPYREALDNMINELAGPTVPVLTKCPDRNLYVVSPSLHTATHFKMLRFLGQLMGIALRSKMPCNLNLAPVIWKKLVGQAVGNPIVRLS